MPSFQILSAHPVIIKFEADKKPIGVRIIKMKDRFLIKSNPVLGNEDRYYYVTLAISNKREYGTRRYVKSWGFQVLRDATLEEIESSRDAALNSTELQRDRDFIEQIRENEEVLQIAEELAIEKQLEKEKKYKEALEQYKKDLQEYPKRLAEAEKNYQSDLEYFRKVIDDWRKLKEVRFLTLPGGSSKKTDGFGFPNRTMPREVKKLLSILATIHS